MGQMKNLAIDSVLDNVPKATDKSDGTVCEVPEAKRKVLATCEAGSEPKIVIDDLCLALLLNAMYGQNMIGGDWNKRRGDMFMFADNLIVRSCVTLWDKSKQERGSLSTIERYLFNLLDYQTIDLLYDIENTSFRKSPLMATEDLPTDD